MFIERMINLPNNKHFFLFGPRQTGKSTLLKNQFHPGSAVYYDLLKSDVYRTLLARPEIFRNEVIALLKSKKPSHIVIDEVQRIPHLLDEVHSLIESEARDSMCSFILSGSSSRKLKRYQANMLAGRAWTFHLHPFSYLELKDDLRLVPALKYGTLPTVYLSEDEEDKRETLRSYVDTYVKEEIEVEANIRNLSGFLRFLPIAGFQNGDILNYSNIARDCGVSSHIVREYYKILEDTYLGFLLPPYGKSIRKKMVRHPKFYLFDPGIVTALTNRLRVDFQEHSYEFGKAFEHFLILEIIKLSQYFRLDLEISFYRTEKGAEVDCIIESPKGKTIALEIKSSVNPSSSTFKGLYSFKEKVPKAELIMACRAERARVMKEVLVLPWQEAIAHIHQAA